MNSGLPSVSCPMSARHGELGWIEVVAGRRGHEGDDAGLVEAAQRNPLDPGLPAQVSEHRGERVGSRQFGVAIGDDDEEMHRQRRAHDVLEQQQLRGACPLQIVEDEDDRAVLRGSGDEARKGLEHQEAFGLGLGRARRRHIRHALAELGHHAQQFALMLAHMADEDLLGRVRQIVAQRLDEGPVRQADILIAGAEQHHGALTMGGPGSVDGEAGLADAGLARKQEHLALALLGAGPAAGDGCLLMRSSIEPEGRGRLDPRRQRDRPAGASCGSHATRQACTGSGMPLRLNSLAVPKR